MLKEANLMAFVDNRYGRQVAVMPEQTAAAAFETLARFGAHPR
jgi:hypothetical protein